MSLKITMGRLLVVIASILNLPQAYGSSTSDEIKETETTTTFHQKIYSISTADHKIFTQNILTAYFADAESPGMRCLSPGEKETAGNVVVSPFINDPTFLSPEKPKVRIDGTPYVISSLIFDSVPEDSTQNANPPTWRFALREIIQLWEDWHFNLVLNSHPDPTIDVEVPFYVELKLKNALASGENIGWMLKIFTEPLPNAGHYEEVTAASKNLMELDVRLGLFEEKKYIPEPASTEGEGAT